MPRRVAGQENIRKLGKTGSTKSPSYFVTLPIAHIRELGWRDGQKLEINLDAKGTLIISDAKG